MEVIPSIDIRGGKCVRLYMGDYARETVFSESPLDVALRWAELGASRLHVVDLDGAKSGSPVNAETVRAIASTAQVPVQVGGGIRTLAAARDALLWGASRVIFGTAALESPGLIGEACRELGPESVVVSVDARDGYVVDWGWTRKSTVLASCLIERVAEEGLRRFVYTDVSVDGTLTQPNFHAIEVLAVQTELGMIVAGGISSVDDLLALSRLKVEGAIVGRAVYTGDIDLREAIATVACFDEGMRRGCL